MRLKLFLLLSLFASLSLLAQQGIKGVVVDANTGQPVPGLTVMLDNQGTTVTTGPSGDFMISSAQPGNDVLVVVGYGYKDWTQSIEIFKGSVDNVGTIRIQPSNFSSTGEVMEDNRQQIYTENMLTEQDLEDEEGNSQSVAVLTGASDNPFYQAASYDFSLMRFRMRGYQNEYTDTYINGVRFNDPVRGRFNYSMIGGMNQAFKRKTIGIGLDAMSYGFGNIGGTNNIYTFAKDYAPGFRGSVAYTNGNYRWRGMVTYSTGLSQNGWALTLSAVGRYANEGIIPGSFYNSAGYFISLQKVINPQHSLSLVTFGAPTRRASNSATFEEAYQLTGTNLYNSNWGWQEGKKRNARVVESFDPTVILNWLWTPKMGVSLNTGAAFHKSFYSSSALNWYNAADPRPDYYRYLPSWYTDENTNALYTSLWENGIISQIDWEHLYQVNYLNTEMAKQTGTEKGSTYILEKRHSNQASWILNSTLNARLSDIVTLQGGIGANYTVSSYYKTMKDLLGGSYWLDRDQYSERDFPTNTDLAQNDLNNPDRKIYVGDRFGYDYNINSFYGEIWKQFVFNFAKWDLSYSLKASYTTYQRDGKMRNGRAPENSYGKGKRHDFVNVAFKAGALYKLDGRNNFAAHIFYGTEAPLPNYAYVSPRIKDDVTNDLKSQRIFSADLSYIMNYRGFKAIVTGFYTDMRDGMQRTSFYDDLYSTFMNYSLTGIHTVHKGVEIGLSIKLTPSLTLSGAANIARYQYKNRPTGTRSYENGSEADVTQTVYLKNYYVSGTPQEAYTMAFNWAGPHQWYVEVNGTWMNRSYVDLSPVRHVEMPSLYTMANSEAELKSMLDEITTQDKLNECFVAGMSIGKVIYLNRSASLNINLNLDNLFDNKNIQTGGYQQGRFDYKNYTTTKFPNKYYYAQGFKMFLNVGVRF